MEAKDSKAHQGPSIEGMFTTIHAIFQDTTLIVQRLTKDVAHIKKHVVGNGIADNNDDIDN